ITINIVTTHSSVLFNCLPDLLVPIRIISPGPAILGLPDVFYEDPAPTGKRPFLASFTPTNTSLVCIFLFFEGVNLFLSHLHPSPFQGSTALKQLKHTPPG